MMQRIRILYHENEEALIKNFMQMKNNESSVQQLNVQEGDQKHNHISYSYSPPPSYGCDAKCNL